MANLIDKILFQDLESCDPNDVIARTGCSYDGAAGSYLLKVWGHFYDVVPGKCHISARDFGHRPYRDYLHLFILHYLMKACTIPVSGHWISEKDIPGGAGFFRGPHTIPGNLIANAFDNDLKAFSLGCEKLGGKPLAMADAAFSFEITPKIPLGVLFWQGDEDFKCEAKLLFDKTIDQHLPLDIIYALAVEVCCAVKGTAQNQGSQV